MALILKNLKFVCQVFNFEELNKVINLKILFDNLSIKHIRFRTRYDNMYHQVKSSGLGFAMRRVWKGTFFAKVKFEMHKSY